MSGSCARAGCGARVGAAPRAGGADSQERLATKSIPPALRMSGCCSRNVRHAAAVAGVISAPAHAAGSLACGLAWEKPGIGK